MAVEYYKNMLPDYMAIERRLSDVDNLDHSTSLGRYAFPPTGGWEAGTVPRAHKSIHRHILLQVRLILDPKSSAVKRVAETASVQTSPSHRENTTTAGLVRMEPLMKTEAVEAKAL